MPDLPLSYYLTPEHDWTDDDVIKWARIHKLDRYPRAYAYMHSLIYDKVEIDFMQRPATVTRHQRSPDPSVTLNGSRNTEA